MNSDDNAPPEPTDLTWDSDGQPFSQRFGDVYFSRLSGIEESRYVFVTHNNLAERWQTLPPQAHFTIGETGFGTGLNFLVAWNLWRQSAPADARLHFVSVEKYPLTRTQLTQALQLWPGLGELTRCLIAAYPPIPAQGFHRLVFDQGRVHLTLILDDASSGLEQLLPVARPGPHVAAQPVSWAGPAMAVDAWFLDGFAPAKNPGMWTEQLFKTLARLSTAGTTFATFTAASVVKQGMRDAGFMVNKVTGFGRKRHMLCGEKKAATQSCAEPPTAPYEPTWHLTTAATATSDGNKRVQNTPVVIIGAGLAGCHSARALAQRGHPVTILEASSVASGASGNPQGVVYAKASTQDQPLTRFNLAALQFACRYYQSYLGFQECGQACGVMHVAQTDQQAEEYRSFATRYQQEPGFVRWLTQAETKAECGLALTAGALLFPQAGWLNPGQVCRHLLDHANITVKEQHWVERLAQHQGQWQAIGADGALLAEAPQVIIANASDARRLEQTAALPVKPIRGQVSQVRMTAQSQSLRRVLCGRGYIAPAHKGAHCLGASFNLRETTSLPDPSDDMENLAQVAELSPALSTWPGAEHSRVSFRCASPDYLPLVGAVPAAAGFSQAFAALRRNARTKVDALGHFYPGLFVNIGHGSRGLAYTPLCAELLVAMINGEPLPMARDMAMRLHPARFLIRDLKRNKI